MLRMEVITINTDGMPKEQIKEVLQAIRPSEPIKPMTLEELHMNLYGHTKYLSKPKYNK
jgi:hypothetical protein